MKRVWTFSASRGLSLLSSSFCLAIRRNPPLTLPHGRSKRTMISLVTKQSWPIWKSEKPKPKPTQETEDERQARYAREADEMKLKWDARWALDIDERHGVEEWWVDLWPIFCRVCERILQNSGNRSQSDPQASQFASVFMSNSYKFHDRFIFIGIFYTSIPLGHRINGSAANGWLALTGAWRRSNPHRGVKPGHKKSRNVSGWPRKVGWESSEKGWGFLDFLLDDLWIMFRQVDIDK